MCGINGIVDFQCEYPDEQIVRKMNHVLRFRGPDDQGIYRDKHVILGHTRLSIIDVAGSRQPLSNEDQTIWVSFNGEIYNYRELREELMGQGHRFATQGDTETLVHLYEEYGSEMVHRLQGMFAIAIWDTRQQRLFLVRDRMGIKPLYYFWRDPLCVFASEPKAILQHPEVEMRPDTEGLWHYLTYRSVPAPQTLFAGIHKLRPGHWMTVTAGGIRENCYWDIPLPSKKFRKGQTPETTARITDEVESLLLKSVKRRLISDVPLGAFLSGGVDSSLIVAMMHKLTNAPVRTYSVGFDHFASSEVPYARAVSEKFGTDHHELILDEECFSDHLEKLTWVRDSPLSEPADIPLYLLARLARKDVKVLLSGEGSDEIFGGYPKYAYDRYAPLVHFWPRAITGWVEQHLPARLRRVEVALRSMCEKDPATRWAQWFSPFTPQEKYDLLGVCDAPENANLRFVRKSRHCHRLDAQLYVDCKVWLPENLLDRGDRMTMGASVEGRVPFLDHELVEYVFQMPPERKVQGFTRKWQIKQIALKYLPEEIVQRRKVGFSVPLAQWFRGKLRDVCYDRICRREGLMREMLCQRELETILDDHCAGRKDNALKIWTLLGLSLWDEVFRRNIQKERCLPV